MFFSLAARSELDDAPAELMRFFGTLAIKIALPSELTKAGV
jgi:hypothetical protein